MIRDMAEIQRDSLGVNISNFSYATAKVIICPDDLACKGRHMVINPKNPNEYICHNCGYTQPVRQAIMENKVKALTEKYRQNTFIISQQQKKKKKKRYYDNMGHELELEDDDLPEQAQIISDETIIY